MEKINVAEILKKCPSGMELDCSIYDNVTLVQVQEDSTYPIKIETPEGRIVLTKYGGVSYKELAKCVIFPKGKTTWEDFVPPYKFKDGDIVTRQDRGSLVACIYKERKNTTSFYHHIALYNGGIGIILDGEIVLTDDELCFATEEEKKKLFDAIKKHGYKWNANTKTLEKLIEPKFKVGDKVRHKNNHNVVFTISSIEEDSYVCGGKMAFCFNEQDDYELAPDKFDITTLVPFESRVLVRNHESHKWSPAMWGYYDYDSQDYPYKLVGCVSCYRISYEGNDAARYCIPYEGNEHLLGTTNDCDEYFKTW